MKRVISMLMVLTMLVCTLVACGGDTTDPNKETTPAADGTTPAGDGVVETTPEETTEYLEAQDLEGYVFRYLTHSSKPVISYDPEELDTNSIADQAKIKRDSEVKDKFNVVFEDVWSGDGVISGYVIKDAMLTESTYDVGTLQGSENAAAIITNNAAYNVRELPNVNIDMPWFSQQANEEYSIMGSQYFFACLFPGMPGPSTFLFNKDMIIELGLELPYDIMFEGDWTMEKFKEYVSAGYVDMDGVAGPSDGDIFGYSGHVRSLPYFFWGFGASNTARDENGAVIPVLSNDRIDYIYNVLSDFKRMQEVTMNSSLDKENGRSSHRIFFDGNSMFCYWITVSIQFYDIDTFEYGLGILPKIDEDQETYYNPTSGGCNLVACNIAEPEKAGLIIEAMGEASYRITYPAAIQEAIKFERYCDEESIEMKKLVDSTLSFDILAICDPTGGQLANCTFIWHCLENNVPPSIAAQGMTEAFEKMFHDFYYPAN